MAKAGRLRLCACRPEAYQAPCERETRLRYCDLGVLESFLNVREAVMKQGVVHNVAGKQQVCAWSLRRSRPSSVCGSRVRLRGKERSLGKTSYFPGRACGLRQGVLWGNSQ